MAALTSQTAYDQFQLQISFHFNDQKFLESIKLDLLSALKQQLPPDQFQRLLSQPESDLKDQVLTLLNALRPFVAAEPVQNLYTRVQENLRALEENRKKEAQAKHAILRPTIHQQLNSAIRTAISHFSPPASTILQESADTVQTAIEIDPQSAIPAVYKFITTSTDQPVFSEAAVAVALAPLIQPAAEIDPSTAIFVAQTSDSLSESVPEQLAPEITAALVIHKSTEPSPNQIESFTRSLEVYEEAAHQIPITIPNATKNLVANYVFPDQLEDQLTFTLQTYIQNTTATDPVTAQEISQNLVSTGLAKLAYDISTFTPHQPTASPASRSHQNEFTFQATTSALLQNLSQKHLLPSKFNIQRLTDSLHAPKPAPSTPPSPKSVQQAQLLSHFYHQLAQHQPSEQPSEPRRRPEPSSDTSPLREMLDLLDQGESFIRSYGPDAYDALVNYFRASFTETSIPAGLSLAPAAIGAATGATAAVVAAARLSPVAKFLVAETWAIQAKELILTDALQRGLLTHIATSNQYGAALFLIKPEGFAWVEANIVKAGLGSSALAPWGARLEGGVQIVSGPAKQLFAKLLGSGTSTALTTAGTETALATTGAATTIGLLANPIVGAIVGFIVGLLLPTIIKYTKKLIEALGGAVAVLLMTLGGIIGTVVGGVLGGTLGIGLGYTAHQAWTMFTRPTAVNLAQPTLIQKAASVGHTIAVGLATTTVTEIITPILIILLAIPPVIAIFLFIINNSAYVVPPDTQGLINGGPPPPITPGPGGSYPYCWPVSVHVQVSGYWPNCEGSNHDPRCFHFGSSKNAIDLGTSIGTSVYSAHNGYVSFAGWNTFGYGNLIVIHSASTGIDAYYGHLSGFTVASNPALEIPAGTLIGYSGSTGNSTGPHLHYENQPSSLNFRYMAPFGDRCERYQPGHTPNIEGCQAQASGGSPVLPTACHN